MRAKSHGAIIATCYACKGLMDKRHMNNNNNTHEQGMRARIDWQQILIPCPKKFLDKFPDLTENKAQKYFNRYLRVVSLKFVKRIPFLDACKTDMSLKWLIDTMGDFNYKNKRYYIWNEFKDIFPFFHIADRKDVGNNITQQITKVTIMEHNYKYIESLIEGMEAEQLVYLFYGNLTEEQYDQLDSIPVDIKSLDNFIKHCDKELSYTHHIAQYKNAIRKNRYKALYTKVISEFFAPAYKDVPTLPMLPDLKTYGRIYYKGINPMNMSREVRRAVIGDYYQYDLNASVYAIKLVMAKDILQELNESYHGKFTYTKDYIDRKSKIREQLATECLTDMKLPKKKKIEVIKSAITAIGFGAHITESSWINQEGEREFPALHDVIKNRQDRERFQNDSFVVNFVKEQKELTDFIVNHWLKDTNFVEKISVIKDMFTPNGKPRNNQVMAYLFQHTETAIMQAIEKLTPNLVCRVHDAIITKNPIPNTKLLEIKQLLCEISGSGSLTELTIDSEHFSAWTNPDNDELEDDDDPRDQYVKEMYKQSAIKFDGNYKAYDLGCVYEPQNENWEEEWVA